MRYGSSEECARPLVRNTDLKPKSPAPKPYATFSRKSRSYAALRWYAAIRWYAATARLPALKHLANSSRCLRQLHVPAVIMLPIHQRKHMAALHLLVDKQMSLGQGLCIYVLCMRTESLSTAAMAVTGNCNFGSVMNLDGIQVMAP